MGGTLKMQEQFSKYVQDERYVASACTRCPWSMHRSGSMS